MATAGSIHIIAAGTALVYQLMTLGHYDFSVIIGFVFNILILSLCSMTFWRLSHLASCSNKYAKLILNKNVKKITTLTKICIENNTNKVICAKLHKIKHQNDFLIKEIYLCVSAAYEDHKSLRIDIIQVICMILNIKGISGEKTYCYSTCMLVPILK